MDEIGPWEVYGIQTLGGGEEVLESNIADPATAREKQLEFARDLKDAFGFVVAVRPMKKPEPEPEPLKIAYDEMVEMSEADYERMLTRLKVVADFLKPPPPTTPAEIATAIILKAEEAKKALDELGQLLVKNIGNLPAEMRRGVTDLADVVLPAAMALSLFQMGYLRGVKEKPVDGSTDV